MPDLNIAEIPYVTGEIRYRYARYMSPDGTRWIRHGLFRAFHVNGALASEGNYVDGAEQGVWRDYHANGQLAAEGHYEKGVEALGWRFWMEDGSPGKQFDVLDLISLLKVFDANYAQQPEDCEKIAGLDINDAADVGKAVTTLLIDEFSAYDQKSRKLLMGTLRFFLADKSESFERLFRQLGLIFDQSEPTDKRAFMAAVLAALEARGY